jgi:alpha-beta hydrolase superfamily lysophospholipase
MSFIWWLGLALALFVVVSLTIATVFSNIVLYSRRQPIVRTPAEYGLEYEEVEFPSTDGLTLRGWFIPARPRPSGAEPAVVILTHPMPFNRHGFVAKNQGWLPLFKTDVDLLKTAHALHQAGYAVLTFDFRNHGESEGGLTGVGLTEYQDVLGAVAYVERRTAGQAGNTQRIGFVSFCMGANSTLVALSKNKELMQNVRFVVAIQPVSADVFFRSYMRNVYTPLSLYLIPLVDRLVRWRGGFGLREMSPLPFVPDVEVPTLYVQARQDPWTELGDIESFYEATPDPKELWYIEGQMRRFEAYNYVGDHPERLLDFAAQHCPPILPGEQG